jgi:FkbM family methyltransferase
VGILRRWLRSLSAGRVIVKRIPDDLGGYRAHCTPEAMLSVWRPGWRSGGQADLLFRWARRFVEPGMTVWDVGANQGLFSLAARSRVGSAGRVFAFEPDPFLASLVERSFSGLPPGGADARVLAIALSDRTGTAGFSIARTDRALNHLVHSRGNPRTGGSRNVISVPTETADDLSSRLGPPDLVKIDVEGAEVAVLEGMAGVLATSRPRIIVEVAPECSDRIRDLLRSRDYGMLDASAAGVVHLERPAWNTLAVPREGLDRIPGEEGRSSEP